MSKNTLLQTAFRRFCPLGYCYKSYKSPRRFV